MARRVIAVVCFCAFLFCGRHSVSAQQVQGAGFDPEPVHLDAHVPGVPRPVTPYDLLSLRDPQGMSISPDGKHIAFVVGQAISETNSYRSGLFVVATEERSTLFGRSAARDRRIGMTSISGFQKLRSGPTIANLLVTACASRLASIGKCGDGT